MTVSIDSAAIAAPLAKASQRLTESRFVDALWNRRLDVWPNDTAARKVIANRLGWLTAVDSVSPHVDRLRACAQAIRSDGITDIVLLGMGGSSLAPEVLRTVIGVAPGFPRFRVLDSVDPDAVRAALAPAATAVFVLASKSGGTIEPNVMAAEAAQRLRAAGVANVGSRFIAITDEGTALHARAAAEGYREVFVNPGDIGGRYSVLSLFGMVPAALMGIDVDALLASAREMAAACRADDPAANPGLLLGAAMAAGAQTGRDKLTLRMPERLEPFGLWVEQLVAESTGKHGRGVVPIVGEDPAVLGRRSLGEGGPVTGDRLVVSLTLDDQPLTALGGEFFRWEFATATAGFLLDINPFDEPNVQQAKDVTKTLLDTYTTQRRLPAPESHASIDGTRLTLSSAAQDALNGQAPLAFLRTIGPGDYAGLLAYLPSEDEQYEPILRAIRTEVGTRFRCATMLGYGPRYLHSTGQLHKGGANNGVFIVITAPPAEDLAIPGEPFAFGVLELAQALGDFASLERTGRRALLLNLSRRDPALLSQMFERLLQLT